LHIVMLHAPDFLGYPDAVAMARDRGDAVERGLALKKRPVTTCFGSSAGVRFIR
jgi:hypothetical protein